MYHSAYAWLANYLNPVRNTIFDTLHEGCREMFLADHPHVTVRPGLPLVKSLFKSMVCYSTDFTVPAYR